MEMQDIWIIVLTPLAVVAFVLAATTGECKRVGMGTYKECAVDSWEHFGERDLPYEAKIRAFTGDE